MPIPSTAYSNFHFFSCYNIMPLEYPARTSTNLHDFKQSISELRKI